jgi:hypothetical protein
MSSMDLGAEAAAFHRHFARLANERLLDATTAMPALTAMSALR